MRIGTKVLAMVALGATACVPWTTHDEGQGLQKQIDDLRTMTAQNARRSDDLSKQTEVQVERVNLAVSNAANVLERNSADLGLTVQKMQSDLGRLTGQLDDLQHAQDALTRQFQEYRAASDAKLEQLDNALTAVKTPPIPETADALFAEAERRLEMRQWSDARRLFGAFGNRYPQDPRAARAQLEVGEAWAGEGRWANAIGAYTKVLDNYPHSDVIADVMYKSGLCFYALKYCGDARTYFQELLKRYPRTPWKDDARLQLRKLEHDRRDKAICTS